MKNSFEGCIIGGAIGDAWGSSYEFESVIDFSKTYVFGKLKVSTEREWRITDDTQLTLATCEALCDNSYSPKNLSEKFLNYYKSNKLSGIGASTLKALKDLEIGIHWSLSGRTGEYSAGNGVAMRIAPFAFFPSISREDIYNASKITHKNDEAYTGALSVFFAIKSVVDKEWNGTNDLFEIIINQLPDTRVRDRLIEISKLPDSATINDVSKFGNNGYVVNSVPFAIYSATKILKMGMSEMFREIIQAGGDTDTNSSIAGQIAGTLIGIDNIPKELISRIKEIREYCWIKEIIDRTKIKIE